MDLGIALGGAAAITFVCGIIYVLAKKYNHGKVVKEYKAKLAADAARVNQERKAIVILRAHQSAIQTEIDKNTKYLNQLYSMNIIYPKYRHMIAVITMLEYFESGICNQLSGANGAYSRYSYEEQIGAIIGKLDIIISQLDDIRNTQKMLYNTLQETNAIASQICTQAERLSESNGKIADNTALIRYNSDRIRMNTEISAYLNMFS